MDAQILLIGILVLIMAIYMSIKTLKFINSFKTKETIEINKTKMRIELEKLGLKVHEIVKQNCWSIDAQDSENIFSIEQHIDVDYVACIQYKYSHQVMVYYEYRKFTSGEEIINWISSKL